GGGEVDLATTRAALEVLPRDTPRHPAWLVAMAVGIDCAAFGRLLGVDWPGTLPVLLASTLGQLVRGFLLARGANVFLAVNAVAFSSALLGGWRAPCARR